MRPEESSAVLPPYEADDGINVRARLRAAYYFSRNWSFAVSAEYERLNDSAADSPIVDNQGVLGWFAGVAWRF